MTERPSPASVPTPAESSFTGAAIRLRLFLCSYVPLFVIGLIRFENLWVQLACALLALAGALLGYTVIRQHRLLVSEVVRVAQTEDHGPHVAGYLATYLLPFVTVAQPSVRDLAAYVLFLMVVAVVYIRSDMLQINPTLYLAGWTVNAVTLGGGSHSFLIARRRPLPGTEHSVVRLDHTVFLEFRDR